MKIKLPPRIYERIGGLGSYFHLFLEDVVHSLKVEEDLKEQASKYFHPEYFKNDSKPIKVTQKKDVIECQLSRVLPRVVESLLGLAKHEIEKDNIDEEVIAVYEKFLKLPFL